EVVRIESAIAIAHLKPLHDIRPERQAIRARMARIESEMKRAGAAAVGPGHYALGRGHLAVGEPEKALIHLQAAYDRSYRPADLPYVLGLARGQVYRRKWKEAQVALSGEARAASIAASRREYRDVAIALLRDNPVPPEQAQHVRALIAYYEER